MTDTDQNENLPDQRAHWEEVHAGGRMARYAERGPTDFAQQIATRLGPAEGRTLLELGCGSGNDAVYFAAQGWHVTATDFSKAALAGNRERIPADTGIVWEWVDMAQGKLPYDDQTFDVVYAHLSLHYFSDAVTRSLIAECGRVLRPGSGRLCFLCKSTEDAQYGIGQRVAPDTYVAEGHLRHFFSPAYVRSLLEEGGDASWEIERLQAGRRVFYKQEAAFVEAIACRSRPATT